MNQRDKILRHMRDYGSISQMEAVSFYGCYRLGARIHELKKQGVEISREMEHTRNRYGEPVSFARYRLEGSAENGRREMD